MIGHIEYRECEVSELVRQFAGRKKKPSSDLRLAAGIYALFINDPRVLPTLSFSRDGFLCIGMTADRAGERNHFAHPHSGFSSPRRLLGALLKATLGLRAIPRSSGSSPTNCTNYRFRNEGEATLTRWMVENLLMSHVPMSMDRATIERMEEKLIAYLQPPLNLKGMADSATRTNLALLRKLCKDEARRSKWSSE
jgi:hypothetical protein